MKGFIKQPGERVHKVFIDPHGNHVLFTVVSASSESHQTYYLHVREAEPVKVNKFIRANVVIETVGWDKGVSISPADDTGSILIGGTYVRFVFVSFCVGARCRCVCARAPLLFLCAHVL